MCKAVIEIFKKIFSPKITPVIVPIPDTTQPKIDPNPWQVFSSIDPDDKDNILKATYCDEFGAPKTFFCMVVFSNDQTHQYKLLSPDLGSGIIIEKGNLTDFTVIKIPKSEKENYGKLKP